MKRLLTVYLFFGWYLALSSPAQMKEPADWVGYEKVLGVKNGLRSYQYDVLLTDSYAPANVFWPGDDIRFTFQLKNNTPTTIDTEGKIHIIRYGTRGIPNDIWLPEMVELDYEKIIPCRITMTPDGYADIPVEINDITKYGGYAVVFDLGENGRRLGTSFVYSMKPSPVKMQYPKQSLDDLGVEFLSRTGVQAIRKGVPYVSTTSPDYRIFMQEFTREMKKYMDNNITVMLMFGEGRTASSMPLGTPRPHLDENGIFLRTKQDLVWLPDRDDDFKAFVKELCLRFGWPDGPVTAVCLWNEPWEGTSISGWQSDMIRYREIYMKMAEAVIEAREGNKDILVGGTDSNSNVWDKFFSDGTMKMLPYFDFLSIHYQGMDSPVLYPEWNHRENHKGRVLIWDTESWVGNTDDRIGLVVAANRSAGYDRSMGIFGGYMYSGDPHRSQSNMTVMTGNGPETVPRKHSSWSPAAAMGATQNLIGERDFNEILFKKGLPWIMTFEGYHGDRDDGTIVIAGDLGETFGAENILFRNVRSLTETERRIALYNKMKTLTVDSEEWKTTGKELNAYRPITDGKMIVKAEPSFLLYDFYGNIVLPQNGVYEIPLNCQGYFMRTNGRKGSFDRLTNTIRNARIEGYQPLEVIAKDFTTPVLPGATMDIEVSNILNRPVGGTLKVTIDGLDISYPERLSLKAYEAKTIKIEVTSQTRSTDTNNYPLTVLFDGGKDGRAFHYETMHVNYISARTIRIDGKPDDWEGVIPQTIEGSSEASISLTEAAWFPYRQFDGNAEGPAYTYLAYDDDYFYFAAKVTDKTPNKGTLRFETRDDDRFFYPDTSYMQTIYAMQSTLLTGSAPGNNRGALLNPSGRERLMNYYENVRTTQSVGIDVNLPKDRFTRTSLYLPAINQPGVSVTVYDNDSGRELLETKIDKLWEGVYLTLDLCGNIRIRCSAYGWWYTAKLSALFFDPSERRPSTGNVKSSAIPVKKDFDILGDWIGNYGTDGYFIAGIEPKLPEDVSCEIVSEDDITPLVWPEGVRRFTYRKTGILPDGTTGERYDNIQIAFNVIPQGEDGMEAYHRGTMPRYTGYKCSDYEYALNTVAPEYGGGFEIWRMLVPGMPRKHFYPRQPASPYDGAVKDGKLITLREGNTLYTECAIPWNEIPDVRNAIEKGGTVKFSARINDDAAEVACMEIARGRSVSKKNSRAFHPDWKEHWANEVAFGIEK
ncbi:MAG: hypothetical protein LBC19_16460 [Tannerella sp.]|jgi:hypothetical protein|nr:hypothetical protein [Tannerella sp.]